MGRRITAMLRCRGSGPPGFWRSGEFRLGKKQDFKNRAFHSSPGQVRRAEVETMALIPNHSCLGSSLVIITSCQGRLAVWPGDWFLRPRSSSAVISEQSFRVQHS